MRWRGTGCQECLRLAVKCDLSVAELGIDRRFRVWVNRPQAFVAATTITTFVGSGIATAAVTHYLTIKKAREELLRAKLEELFLQ
jgi:hypothetical protein